MHSLIQQLLEKRGVEMTDLDADEKITFDGWQRVLSNDFTLENLKEFMEAQKIEIEKQIVAPDNSDKKDNILKASLGIYLTLLGVINTSSKVEKEALIAHLQDLIKK